MTDGSRCCNGEVDAKTRGEPGRDSPPDRLSARLFQYDDSAYDFPSSGESLHEMTIVSRDPAVIAASQTRPATSSPN